MPYQPARPSGVNTDVHAVSPITIPMCWINNTTITANTTSVSSSHASQVNGWEVARKIFGQIDPFELGPLTGTNLSFIAGIQSALEGYLLTCGSYCLQNPWIAEGIAIFSPIAMTAAVSYDYVYDQVTNTGPYSTLPPRDLPPWSSLSTDQKIERVAVTVIVIMIAVPLVIPK